MEKISLTNIIGSRGFRESFKTMFKYSHSTGKEASVISTANPKTGDFVFRSSFGTFGAMEESHGPSGMHNPGGYSFDKYGKKIDESEACVLTGKIDDSSDENYQKSLPIYCLDFYTHPEKNNELQFSLADLSLYFDGLTVANAGNGFIPLVGVVAAAERKPTALIYRPSSMTELDWLLSSYREDKGMQHCLNKLKEFGAAEIINFNKDGTLSKKDSSLIKKLF